MTIMKTPLKRIIQSHLDSVGWGGVPMDLLFEQGSGESLEIRLHGTITLERLREMFQHRSRQLMQVSELKGRARVQALRRFHILDAYLNMVEDEGEARAVELDLPDGQSLRQLFDFTESQTRLLGEAVMKRWTEEELERRAGKVLHHGFSTENNPWTDMLLYLSARLHEELNELCEAMEQTTALTKSLYRKMTRWPVGEVCRQENDRGVHISLRAVLPTMVASTLRRNLDHYPIYDKAGRRVYNAREAARLLAAVEAGRAVCLGLEAIGFSEYPKLSDPETFYRTFSEGFYVISKQMLRQQPDLLARLGEALVGNVEDVFTARLSQAERDAA